MGRFKIYDPKTLVIIQEDSKYAKCLVCEKVLKNIMGNIKRHYEQIHDTMLDATITTKKKSRKKTSGDKEYRPSKIHKKEKPSTPIVNETNDDYDWINEYQLDCGLRPAITIVSTPTGNKIYQQLETRILNANEEKSSQKTQELKPATSNIMKQNENEILTAKSVLPSGYKMHQQLYNISEENGIRIKQESNPATSNIKNHNVNKASVAKSLLSSFNKEYQQLGMHTKQERNPANNNITNQYVNEKFSSESLASNSQIHNIQILTVDCHEDAAASFKCMLINKTPFNIPLQTFQQGSSFQTALKSWCPDKNFGLENKAVCQHLDNMITILRDRIKNHVANRFIYLKLDLANQPSNLMLVNIQIIKNFEIKIFTLGVLELLDDHNAPVLKGKLLKALQRYDVGISQVFSITKDYTNNIKETFSYPKDEDKSTNENLTPEYCQHMSEQFPGHVLHFVACDVIKQLNENISQSRDSARKLRNRMPQFNILPIPVLDNPNSWISVYDMIKSLHDIRDKIEHNVELLVEVDWLFVNKFVTSFKPVVDTALNLQSNHFVMGDLYRDWLVCESELEELSASNELALYLLLALRKHKVHLFENDSFLAALYLDPRFCYMGSMHFTDKQKNIAIAQLLNIFNKLKSLDKTETNSNSNTTHNNKVNERFLKLERKMTANMGICNKMRMVLQSNLINGAVSLENVDNQSIQESLEQLQFDERLPFHANILDYWKAITYKNPVLARLAEIALASPATQATVNRVFNVLPFMLMKLENKISLENMENMFLLQLNQDLLDK